MLYETLDSLPMDNPSDDSQKQKITTDENSFRRHHFDSWFEKFESDIPSRESRADAAERVAILEHLENKIPVSERRTLTYDRLRPLVEKFESDNPSRESHFDPVMHAVILRHLKNTIPVGERQTLARDRLRILVKKMTPLDFKNAIDSMAE